MNRFDGELEEALQGLQAAGLYRELRPVDSAQAARITVGGRELLNFSSNDYLGLANEPVLKEAAIRAVATYGAGSGASRLICGSLRPHHDLEDALAAFKGTEAALSFSSGYAAALGAITALAGRDDYVVIDRLVHACIVEAARHCGAKLRVFPHNDPAGLDSILRWIDGRKPAALPGAPRPRTLIITESVFSMDGDLAPLRKIVDLKDQYGACLMVDEAHATGLFGANRRGLAESLGVGDRIEVQMGTLGKALGAAGGYLCGSRRLVDFLLNRARTFIFSTAPVPAAVAAAAAGVGLVRSAAGAARLGALHARIAELPSPPRPAGGPAAAIFPIIIGDETAAVATSAALREGGVFIPAVRFPTVARGSARLRLTLTASHTSDDLARLAAALRTLSHGLPGPA